VFIHTLRISIPYVEFCFAKLRKMNTLACSSIRSALAYPKRSSLRAVGSEKGALHTRLEAGVCFDICFFGASPLRGVGLSAPIYLAALRKFRFNPSYDYCQEALRSPAKPRPSMLSPFRFPLFFFNHKLLRGSRHGILLRKTPKLNTQSVFSADSRLFRDSSAAGESF
jgi:hypothetical protein